MSKKIGRNDPCPCGSGKKHKKCCLEKEKHDETSVDIQKLANAKIQDIFEKENERKKKFGHVKPIIHSEFKGSTFVAVGDAIPWSERWTSFPAFLQDYFWIPYRYYINEPPPEGHPAVIWFHDMVRYHKEHIHNPERIVANGSMLSFMTLSYDLYTVQHNMMFQESIIKRMAHNDQFQGARYELFAAATCIRAGFAIEYEEDEKGERKYTELIATHKITGQKISLEAKSQKRDGLLGYTGTPDEDEKAITRFGRLLRDAFKKRPKYPFVIFIDLNLKSNDDLPQDKDLRPEIKTRVLGFNNPLILPDPYNMVILTNHPYHHDVSNILAPDLASTKFISVNPLRRMKHLQVLEHIYIAAERQWIFPSTFEEGS